MAEDLGELSGELCRFLWGEGETGQRGDIRNIDLGRRHMLERVGRKKAIRKKERGGRSVRRSECWNVRIPRLRGADPGWDQECKIQRRGGTTTAPSSNAILTCKPHASRFRTLLSSPPREETEHANLFQLPPSRQARQLLQRESESYGCLRRARMGRVETFSMLGERNPFATG